MVVAAALFVLLLLLLLSAVVVGETEDERLQLRVSTNNGLVNGPVHNLLMQFFTPGSSKIEVFETGFYDIVIT